MRTLITVLLFVCAAFAGQNQKSQVSLTLTVNQEHSVLLTWTAPTTPNGVTSYQVARSTTSGSGYAEVGTTDGSTVRFTDSTVNPHTTYFYVVVAVNAEGDSPQSNQATAAIP